MRREICGFGLMCPRFMACWPKSAMTWAKCAETGQTDAKSGQRSRKGKLTRMPVLVSLPLSVGEAPRHPVGPGLWPYTLPHSRPPLHACLTCHVMPPSCLVTCYVLASVPAQQAEISHSLCSLQRRFCRLGGRTIGREGGDYRGGREGERRWVGLGS